MCDELGGDGEYLRAYVNDFSTLPCSVADQTHCNDKQKTFIATFSAKSAGEQQQELDRLTKMATGLVKPELLKWLKQRATLLTQILSPGQILSPPEERSDL